AVLLYDLSTIARFGLVIPLFAGADAGGFVGAERGWWGAWFGLGEGSATALYALLWLAAAGLTFGVASRVSALALVLLGAQWAQLLPDADRAIDLLLRNVTLILAFSAAGRAWSFDAWRATGSVRGSGEVAPAWPRYLIVVQVVVMYFTAGVQKYGQHWWPWGRYSALYVILHDWSYAAFDFDFAGAQPFWFLTQLASGVTLFWQWTYPMVLLHYFGSPDGRLRRLFDRVHLHWVWIGVGALFHVLIAGSLQLGIFPYAMLALYPAFVQPEDLARLSRDR
ncbi:MAG: HTTM domain-containing protein, partial [Myxococcota bacterium]